MKRLVHNFKFIKRFVRYCIVILLLCLFSGPAFSKPLNVFVSIAPQKNFVESVAGDLVKVSVLVGSGQSPETFRPSPSQLTKLSRAKILFTIGIPFEKSLLRKVTSICPDILIVKTDKGIIKRKMFSNHRGHNHGQIIKGDDPHIWLDPIYVKTQAENIAKGLIKQLPTKKPQILKNLKSFQTKLDELVKKINFILSPLKNKILLTFHPAFGYFADRFGLVQESIQLEGKSPGPRQLAKIIRKCRKEQIKAIFTEDQFSSDVVETISKAINGKVISVNPLAENYIENLTKFSKTIASNLK